MSIWKGNTMAEFCLECWNRINKTNDDPKKYIISKDLDLCEGCGEWKNVIIYEKKAYYQYMFRFIVIPFKVICKIKYLVWWIFIFFSHICKYNRKRKNNIK